MHRKIMYVEHNEKAYEELFNSLLANFGLDGLNFVWISNQLDLRFMTKEQAWDCLYYLLQRYQEELDKLNATDTFQDIKNSNHEVFRLFTRNGEEFSKEITKENILKMDYDTFQKLYDCYKYIGFVDADGNTYIFIDSINS